MATEVNPSRKAAETLLRRLEDLFDVTFNEEEPLRAAAEPFEFDAPVGVFMSHNAAPYQTMSILYLLGHKLAEINQRINKQYAITKEIAKKCTLVYDPVCTAGLYYIQYKRDPE